MFKVLLATDGSQSSFKAVDKTIQLVKNMKAEVTVLTVVHDAPFYQFYDGLSAEHLVAVQKSIEEGAEKRAREILNKTANRFRENGLEVNTILKKGHPAEVICQVAEEGRFDFVVMGSRGLGGIKELLLGSVSNRVVHCAKCSVLIVR